MKNFCQCLRKHARSMINFKKKKMKLLKNERKAPYKKVKICYICGEKFEDKYANNKKDPIFRDSCHYASNYSGAAHSISLP